MKKNNKQLLEKFLALGLLKRVKRTGWVLAGVEDAESVADHTYRVALMAMVLATKFNLDQLKSIKMALIHDLGETAIGDIKWESGTKIIGSKEDKQRDERKSFSEVFSNDENYLEYLALWDEFHEQVTPEAKFVKQLDKLEMIIQAYEYQKEGYKEANFGEFWDNATKYLEGKEFDDFLQFLKKSIV